MTTGTEIVQSALENIGAHSALQPAPAEALDRSYKALNGMIAEWQDDGIDLGCVPLKVIGDELSEPLGTRLAIEYQLSLVLAPKFPGAQVSSQLLTQANKAFNKLKRRWKSTIIPKTRVRGTLPVGQGNKADRWDDPFFEEGAEIG